MALVVVRDKSEVHAAISRYAEVIGRLFRGRKRLPQPIDLLRLFVDLLLRDADRDVELRNLRYQLRLFVEDVQGLRVSRVFLEDLVRKQDLADFAVRIGV